MQTENTKKIFLPQFLAYVGKNKKADPKKSQRMCVLNM